MFDAQLETCFWAEAVVTAAYIVNRLPSKQQQPSPEEIWTGLKPDLQHMRVFGCRAMAHIPKELRTKFQPKSKSFIFVGYSPLTKGYQVASSKSAATSSFLKS